MGEGRPGASAPARGLSLRPEHILLLGGGCVALVVGVGSAVAPRLVAGAVLGAFAVAGVWRFPKCSAGIAVVVILLGQPVGLVAPSLKLLDEATTVVVASTILLQRVVAHGRLRRFRGGTGLLIYLVAGECSSLVHHVPVSLSLADAFLFMKGPFLGLAVAQLPWTPRDIRVAIRLGTAVAVFVFACTAVNIALPGAWYTAFGIGDPSIRGGFSSLIGPFTLPGFFGQFMALLASAAVAYRIVLAPKSRAALAVLALSFLGVAASLRRKAVIGALSACATVVLSVRRTRMPALTVGLLVLVVAVAASWETINTIVSDTYDAYINGADPAARTVLYQTSYKIGLDDFPLGVGLGRFGGATAFTAYSPVYAQYGIADVYGLRPGEHFATDTFWPAILGQGGWLGMLGYAGGLAAMLQGARRLASSGVPEWRFLGLVAAAWWIEYLIESFASPVYSSPPVYALLFATIGVMSAALAVHD